MADTLRIKRRTTGLPGAPSGMANAEIAYNEVDHTLYYGEGTGGTGGTASTVVPIGGQGLAYTSNPAMNAASASPGSAGLWARGDHIHQSDSSRAPTASPTFTGTTTVNGTIAGTALPAFLLSPGPIGSTTPSTGSFTNLTISGTLTGASFTTLFATPPPIGSTTANTGAFTALSASGVVSGAGFTTLLAPYAPLAGPSFTGTASFVNLTASGTVSLPAASSGITALTADSSTLLATTAFVKAQGYITSASLPVASSTTPVMDGAAAIGILSTYARGDHVHPSDTSKANLASPTFTGTPTLPTGTIGVTQTFPNSTTALATTAFVSVNFAPINSPSFTGIPLAPTATAGTNNTQIATTAFARQVSQDLQAVPGADVSWNNFKLINLGAPLNNTDAATKLYVDQNATGLSAKSAAAVGTTGANISLAGGLPIIDGYQTLANDRVLVKDQTAAATNGIYVATSTAWVRALDMDTWPEVPQAYVFVTNGTINSSSSWVCNSPLTGGTLGTTAITWVQFSQQASLAAGAGLTRTGNTFDVVGIANRITVLADSVDIASTYVGQTSITTLGTIATGTWAGTDITVPNGGTGVSTLTAGYVKASGTSPFTSVATIPSTDISGLGTAAITGGTISGAAITGGTIDGVVFDMGSF